MRAVRFALVALVLCAVMAGTLTANDVICSAGKLRSQDATQPGVIHPAALSPAQGGEDISTAFIIPSLPFLDSGTTAGYAPNYATDSCGGTMPRPDVVYGYTPDTYRYITISLCESSFNTKMWVYRADSTTVVACSDNACGETGQQAQIVDLLVSPAFTYYFIVSSGSFVNNEGDYVLSVETPLLEPLSCPGNSLFGQVASPDSIDDGYGSDVGLPGHSGTLFDNFTCPAGEITGVRFWGGTFDWNTGTACTENPINVEIKIYKDSLDAPGPEIASYVRAVTGVPTGWYYNSAAGLQELLEYETSFPAVTSLDGWISIQGIDTPGCQFLWFQSPDGDGLVRYYRSDTDSLYVLEGDMAYCLVGTAGPYIGACCDDQNECTLTDQVSCENAGGAYQGDCVECALMECASSSCCSGLTGNIDGDLGELVDIGDLTALISYLYIPPNPEPVCPEEANIDGDTGGLIDIGDLTALISYLYIPPNPPPADCP